ncbi:MAG TPA: hypothetical protein VH639_06710 [Bryobacteraceae bacterium]
MIAIRLNGIGEYRCLVGHNYSARGLLEAHSEAQERALWMAVVALEETEQLVNAVAGELPDDLVRRLREQVETKHHQAETLRKAIEALEPFYTGGDAPIPAGKRP